MGIFRRVIVRLVIILSENWPWGVIVKGQLSLVVVGAGPIWGNIPERIVLDPLALELYEFLISEISVYKPLEIFRVLFLNKLQYVAKLSNLLLCTFKR